MKNFWEFRTLFSKRVLAAGGKSDGELRAPWTPPCLNVVYLLFNVHCSTFTGGETAYFAAIFYIDKKFSIVLPGGKTVGYHALYLNFSNIQESGSGFREYFGKIFIVTLLRRLFNLSKNTNS
jgi:hypothetical protein